MFPARDFPSRYFPDRYWPKGAEVETSGIWSVITSATIPDVAWTATTCADAPGTAWDATTCADAPGTDWSIMTCEGLISSADDACPRATAMSTETAEGYYDEEAGLFGDQLTAFGGWFAFAAPVYDESGTPAVVWPTVWTTQDQAYVSTLEWPIEQPVNISHTNAVVEAYSVLNLLAFAENIAWWTDQQFVLTPVGVASDWFDAGKGEGFNVYCSTCALPRTAEGHVQQYEDYMSNDNWSFDTNAPIDTTLAPEDFELVAEVTALSQFPVVLENVAGKAFFVRARNIDAAALTSGTTHEADISFAPGYFHDWFARSASSSSHPTLLEDAAWVLWATDGFHWGIANDRAVPSQTEETCLQYVTTPDAWGDHVRMQLTTIGTPSATKVLEFYFDFRVLDADDVAFGVIYVGFYSSGSNWFRAIYHDATVLLDEAHVAGFSTGRYHAWIDRDDAMIRCSRNEVLLFEAALPATVGRVDKAGFEGQTSGAAANVLDIRLRWAGVGW